MSRERVRRRRGRARSRSRPRGSPGRCRTAPASPCRAQRVGHVEPARRRPRSVIAAAPPTAARRRRPRTAAPSTMPMASGPPPAAIVRTIIATPITTMSDGEDASGRRGLIRRDAGLRAPRALARRAPAAAGCGGDSMITRHGRSASTVSSVLPNTDAPATRRGSAITTAAARMSCASSMIRRPAWPARTFSQCPDTRPPPCSLACSMIESGGGLGVGHRGVDLQRVRDGDRDEHVDPAALARGELDRGGDDLLVVAVARRRARARSRTPPRGRRRAAAIATLWVEARSSPWRRRKIV